MPAGVLGSNLSLVSTLVAETDDPADNTGTEPDCYLSQGPDEFNLVCDYLHDNIIFYHSELFFGH